MLWGLRKLLDMRSPVSEVKESAIAHTHFFS